MKYAYYPGCSLESTAKEYGQSVKAVCHELGIELEELEDWNCCGASSAHCTNFRLSHALAGRNLALAEKQGLDIAVACAACFLRLKSTKHEFEVDARVKEELPHLIGMPYEAKHDIHHLLGIVSNAAILPAVRKRVRKPLTGLKLASYYGCFLVRPPKVTQFDDPENPQSMDMLMDALGAEAVDWSGKVDCCGGSFALTRTDIVAKLVSEIVDMARGAGAEAIVGPGGQVLYHTPVPDLYPLASIDSIADTVQTDAEIMRYELNNTRSGFHGGTVLHYPGDIEEGSKEEEQIRETVGGLTGSDGPGVMVIFGDEDFDLSKSLKSLDDPSISDLYDGVSQRVEKTVVKKFGIPQVLLAIQDGTGIFAQKEMQDAFIWYNIKTKKFRNVMARIFKSFGELWHEGPLDFGKIKEREYETPVFRQEVVQPGQQVEAPPTEEQETEAKLTSIYGSSRYNRYATSGY